MKLRFFLAALTLFGADQAAHAAAWGVGPLRLDLDRSTRSGVINVTNDDAMKLNFEIRLMRWSQDENGADRYEPSDDLVYFPRVAVVEPAEKRVIRVGSRGEAPPMERTYRLFIEEMPDPASAAQKGAGIAVKGRFAIPIFVAPAKGEPKGEFVDIAQARGGVKVRLRNNGNQHYKIDTVTLRSEGAVVKEANGWYVLAGATRAFQVPLTGEECGKLSTVEVHLKGEVQEFRQTITLDRARCGP